MKAVFRVQIQISELHSSDDDYRGITADNQLHYRGNPSTGYSIPAVLPQDSWENPRYYRGYRGITAVPITVQLSTLER